MQTTNKTVADLYQRCCDAQFTANAVKDDTVILAGRVVQGDFPPDWDEVLFLDVVHFVRCCVPSTTTEQVAMADALQTLDLAKRQG